MMADILKIFVCTSLFLVAACGNKDQEDTYVTAVYADLKDKYANRGKSSKGSKPAERDLSWVATNKKPLTIVLVEKWQGMGFLALQVQNGPYKTWRAKDGTTFTFKGPFMTGTKALGDDLMSASVPKSIASSGAQNRTHYYLNNEDQMVARSVRCEWKFVGSETIPVLTKSYSTKHYKESCSQGDLAFKNDYWLDSSGIARQSRQFVSETVGYVSLLKILE